MPRKDAAWNRGAYLVNGPGHCAECHSPRNLLGGIVESQRFAGGPEPVGDGLVPNITPEGPVGCREENLVKLLETGETPDGDTVGGEMAKVVVNTGKLGAADREAMATYVQVAAAGRGPEALKRTLIPVLRAVFRVIAGRCAACSARLPAASRPEKAPLARSSAVTASQSAMNLLKAILLKLALGAAVRSDVGAGALSAANACRSDRSCSSAAPSRSCRSC